MNKKTKIFAISVTCASLVFVPTLTAVSIILNSNKIISNAIVNSKLNFMDQDFETKQDVLNYANSISQFYNRRIKTPVKWSINANGETLTFDNQKDIYNYLETNFITKKSYTSYTNDFLTDSIGAILPSEMTKMNFSENAKKQTVYRGKNNSIYLTEKEAKDTYLQAHEVYYFNGIFFRSKEELSNWLEKNIMNIEGSKDLKAYEISFKDPNGGLSLPMKIDDLKKDFEKNITPRPIESFVKTNSKPYFKYKNENNEDAFVSERNVNKLANNYDASYVNLISNQGKGNYIVDTAADDKADLIGPYYVKSGIEILQITDKTKWRKIEGKDNAIADEMVQSELISQFMNLILFSPPNDLDNPKYNESNVYPSKNALYTIPILQEEINTYFDDLYSNFRVVYNSVKSLHDTMSQGKKYGEFLKTPILFVHTIDQIIYYSGDQEFIDKTREIYTKICNHFDKLIYSTIPKKFLKSKNNKYFSIKDLFKVDNLNLDLNYDIDTLISEIVYEYPALYECIQFICNTEMYLSKLNTLEDISFSKDFYLSAFNLKLSDDYIEEYKLIWNILNSNNYDTFFDNVEKVNPEMKEIYPYYYLNNFIQQQTSSRVSKVAISYWLSPDRAKKEFGDELGPEQIKALDEITKPSKKNEWFDMYTAELSDGSYSPYRNFYFHENKQYLQSLYLQRQTVDPILFSRLILYMTLTNNRVNLEKEFKYKNINEMKQWSSRFINIYFLSNYNYLSRFPQKLFSRLNTNFDLIFTKSGIKPIISKDVDFELNSRTDLNKPVTIKQFKKFKMSLRFISFIGSLGDTAAIIKDAFFDTEDNTPWTALSFFIGLFGFAAHIAGIFIPGMGILGSILNFLASTLYKKEFFSYVFETESVKYIWNGGVEESWLCGIIKGEQTTIDDMKLLNPMQVVKPNNLQGYYYNGKIYGDFSKLKNTQLNDILNGRYSNNKFQKVYSLLNLEKETNPISNLYDDSIVNLVKNVSEHIKNLISNDTFENDSIVCKSSYKFGSFVYDDSDTLQNNTNKVLDNIKPMLIAQLPTLNPKGHKLVNKPICNDANGYDDGSLKSYKLPGFSWTAEGGYYQNPDTNFIMIDQNIVDDKDKENKDENNKDNENDDNSSNNSNNKSTSSNKPNKIINFKEELEKQFYASFDVDSKEIDSQFVNSANLFSNLSSKTESNFCYFAKGRDNERKMFLSKNDAINWLLTEFNYKTHYVVEQLKTIFINDLVFSNYDDYVNWVYSNIVEGEQ